MRFFALSFIVVACGAAIVEIDRPPVPAVQTTERQNGQPAQHRDPAPPESPAPVDPRIACLTKSYGDYIRRVDSDDAGQTVVMTDSTALVFDDGVAKRFEEKLASPDLEDQLSIPYPLGPPSGPPGIDDDPGRIRVDGFFRAVYGRDRAEVKSRLVAVPWLPKRVGGTVMFNRENGAAQALANVSRVLDERLAEGMLRYVRRPAGTFNFRTIAGTDRLSAHAFGIAIDIAVKQSHYWRWEKGGASRYQNRIPYEIVAIFEENGFIWGGKWYHFDTMHFEYRPALFIEGCRR